MSEVKGDYIKLYRSFQKWEWYQDPNTARLFIHLLLKANWKPTKWKGIEIGRGQTIETVRGLAKELKISVRSVRTSLEHLISTHEVTYESTHYGMLISVINYTKYQDVPSQTDTQNDTQSDNQPTHYRHTTDTQPTQLEEYKNIKKERIEEVKREGREKNSKGRNGSMASAPSLQSIKQFFANNSFRSDPDHFYQHYEGLGWKNIKGREITDWKRTAREWERREKKFTEERMTPQSNMIVPAPDYMREDYSFEEDNTPDDLDLEDSET